MKTIIQENHHQKRMWKEACFERDLKSGKFDDLFGDENEFEKQLESSLAAAHHNFQEREASLRTIPSLVGKAKFKLASKYAVAVARHYEMNVHIKASNSLGCIELVGEDIMFDTIWRDGKMKRRFLLLFLLADSVCVQPETEYGNTVLLIWLTYELVRRFHIFLLRSSDKNTNKNPPISQ